jgi:hypothetical protein
MKKSSLIFAFLLVLVAAFSSAAMADSNGSYTVSGTYSSNTMNSALTAPSQEFTFSFNVPLNPASSIESYVSGDDFYLNAMPVNYTFDGSTTTLNNALLSFYTSNSSSQYGGIFIAYCPTDATCGTGMEYQWTFSGPQQYTGDESNPTLVPAGFSYNGQPFTLENNDTGATDCYSSISGSVNSSLVSTPEPSALVLLLAGLAALVLFTKFRV